jgi:hypothetical protein
MIIGDFSTDIDNFIRENLGRVGASKRSQFEINKIGIKVTGGFETGKMYTYRYFTPDESSYDTNPIILYLGLNNSKNLVGINLHYIPLDPRIQLVDKIIRSYDPIISMEIKKAINPKNQKKLDTFIWENVNLAYGRKFNIKYAIRQYKLDRIKKPLLIGYENWYLGTVNNENNFFGTNINEAQSLYYMNI